jgi:hypothetical protein
VSWSFDRSPKNILEGLSVFGEKISGTPWVRNGPESFPAATVSAKQY